MKIWIDLRFLWDNLYSNFVIELVENIIKKEKETQFIIYSNKILDWFDFPNLTIKNILIKNFSIKEQTKFYKILKNDKNDLMIFFNHYKPLFYVWEYVIFIASLKEIYYSNYKNYFEKYSELYLLEKNIIKANKIICFDQNTNNELVEKFNIDERKINLLNWFFPYSKRLNSIDEIKIDIRVKYDIKNDYFIYSWWEWVEKNYEKLVYVFEKFKKENLNIDLVFLWDSISKNVSFRNLILKMNMQNNIHFMWVVKDSEKSLFYKNSLWVIFPSFYEPFPFRLTEALYLNSKIIASDLKNIKDIFWDKINYFSPISVNSIYENTKEFLKNKNLKVDYSEIKNKYRIENTSEKFLEIIK